MEQTSLQIRNSLIFAADEGKISKEDKIVLLGFLMQNLNTTSVSEYAKTQRISHNGAKLRVKANKVKGVYLSGKLKMIVP